MSRRVSLRSAFQRLPPVRRRDQRIAELQRRLADRREELAHAPSFKTRLFAEHRVRQYEVDLGTPSPDVISEGKFAVYDEVASLGIDVPEQFGRWGSPTDIPWNELPDRVVVKSAFGSTSRGVLPVERLDGGWRIVTHDQIRTSSQLVAHLVDGVERGRIRGPFGAEELLDDRVGHLLPIDLKAYSFYGEVPLVVVGRTGRHGDLEHTRYRVVDGDGRDLIDTRSNPALATTTGARPQGGLAKIDLTVPVPPRLDEVVRVASRLSVELGLPFARIDLYSLPGRVVFGEVTPRPGGPQWFGADLDARLGDAWERATARRAVDLAPRPRTAPWLG